MFLGVQLTLQLLFLHLQSDENLSTLIRKSTDGQGDSATAHIDALTCPLLPNRRASLILQTE
jgi:hypothetical protein